MNSILLPTDFSSVANNALEHATALALKHKAKIVLVHSFEMDNKSILYSLAVKVDAVLKQEAEKNSKLTLEQLKNLGLECETVFCENPLTKAVLETADRLNAACIVMGTMGADGLKKIVSGSNTSVIVEKANCPVLVVPEVAKFDDYKRVSFATDYHEKDTVAILKMMTLLKPFEPKINVIHFAEAVNDGETEKLSNFVNVLNAREQYSNLKYEVLEKQSDNIFDSYLKSAGCDLFAMTTSQRYFLQKLFDESQTKQLAYKTEVPLLVFHHALKPIIF